MLNKRLGLDMAGSLKLELDADLYTDEDLLTGMAAPEDVKPDTVGAMVMLNHTSDITPGVRQCPGNWSHALMSHIL